MQKICLVQPALAGGACRERLSPPLCTAYEPSAISDQSSSLHTTHPPRTKEQPQACTIGWQSVTTPVHNKEEGDSCCRQAAPASASHTRQTVCIRLAPKSSRKLAPLVAELIDVYGAKQTGMRLPLLPVCFALSANTFLNLCRQKPPASAPGQTSKQFASATRQSSRKFAQLFAES